MLAFATIASLRRSHWRSAETHTIAQSNHQPFTDDSSVDYTADTHNAAAVHASPPPTVASVPLIVTQFGSTRTTSHPRPPSADSIDGMLSIPSIYQGETMPIIGTPPLNPVSHRSAEEEYALRSMGDNFLRQPSSPERYDRPFSSHSSRQELSTALLQSGSTYGDWQQQPSHQLILDDYAASERAAPPDLTDHRHHHYHHHLIADQGQSRDTVDAYFHSLDEEEEANAESPHDTLDFPYTLPPQAEPAPSLPTSSEQVAATTEVTAVATPVAAAASSTSTRAQRRDRRKRDAANEVATNLPRVHRLYDKLTKLFGKEPKSDVVGVRAVEAINYLRDTHPGVLENDWECVLEKQVRMYVQLCRYSDKCASKKIKLRQSPDGTPPGSKYALARMTFDDDLGAHLAESRANTATLTYGRSELVAGLVGVFQYWPEMTEMQLNDYLCSYPAFVFTTDELTLMPFENNTQMTDKRKWINTKLGGLVGDKNVDLEFVGIPFAPGVMFNDWRRPDGYGGELDEKKAADVRDLRYNSALASMSGEDWPEWKVPPQGPHNVGCIQSGDAWMAKLKPLGVYSLYSTLFFSRTNRCDARPEVPQEMEPKKVKKKKGPVDPDDDVYVERCVQYSDVKSDFFAGTVLLLQACHVCFRLEQTAENQLIKCTDTRCTRYYHQHCIAYTDAAKARMPSVCSYAFQNMRDRMRWTCPLHFSNDKLSETYWAHMVERIQAPNDGVLPTIEYLVPRSENVESPDVLFMQVKGAFMSADVAEARLASRMASLSSLPPPDVAQTYLFWAVSSGRALRSMETTTTTTAEHRYVTNRARMGLCLRVHTRITKGTRIQLDTRYDDDIEPDSAARGSKAAAKTYEPYNAPPSKNVNMAEACSPQQFGMHVFRWLHLASTAVAGTLPNAECITWQETLSEHKGGKYKPNPVHRRKVLYPKVATVAIHLPCIIRATHDIEVGDFIRISDVVPTTVDGSSSSSSAAAATAAAAPAATAARLLFPRLLASGAITYDIPLERALSEFYARHIQAFATKTTAAPHRYYRDVIDMADALRSWPYLFDAVFDDPDVFHWSDRQNMEQVNHDEWNRQMAAWCDKMRPSVAQDAAAASSVATESPYRADRDFSRPFDPRRKSK